MSDPQWGGARKKSGRKPVADKRVSLPFKIKGSLIKKIKENGGRDWLERLVEAAK